MAVAIQLLPKAHSLDGDAMNLGSGSEVLAGLSGVRATQSTSRARPSPGPSVLGGGFAAMVEPGAVAQPDIARAQHSDVGGKASAGLGHAVSFSPAVPGQPSSASVPPAGTGRAVPVASLAGPGTATVPSEPVPPEPVVSEPVVSEPLPPEPLPLDVPAPAALSQVALRIVADVAAPSLDKPSATAPRHASGPSPAKPVARRLSLPGAALVLPPGDWIASIAQKLPGQPAPTPSTSISLFDAPGGGGPVPAAAASGLDSVRNEVVGGLDDAPIPPQADSLVAPMGAMVQVPDLMAGIAAPAGTAGPAQRASFPAIHVPMPSLAQASVRASVRASAPPGAVSGAAGAADGGLAASRAAPQGAPRAVHSAARQSADAAGGATSFPRPAGSVELRAVSAISSVTRHDFHAPHAPVASPETPAPLSGLAAPSPSGQNPGSITMPGGTMPGGTMPGGTMPGGTMPGGTMPGGAMPGGAMPLATPPFAMPPHMASRLANPPDPRDAKPTGRDALTAPVFAAAVPAAAITAPRAGPSQAGPSQAGPSQAGPSQAGPSQAGAPQAVSLVPTPAVVAAIGQASAMGPAALPGAANQAAQSQVQGTAASGPLVAAAAPPPAQQLAQAVAGLQLGADGRSHLSIHLEPAELGQVNIRISSLSNGAASINIAVDRATTLSTLQGDLSHLHEALDRAGIAEQRSIAFHLEPGPEASPARAPQGADVAFSASGQSLGGAGHGGMGQGNAGQQNPGQGGFLPGARPPPGSVAPVSAATASAIESPTPRLPTRWRQAGLNLMA